MTKKLRIIFILLWAMLFLSLSGCAGATPVPEASTEGSTEEIAPDSELVSIMDTAEIDHCLDCHTDKERLISTAKPEEVVIVENEGEG